MLKALLNILLIVLVFLSTIGYVATELTKPDFLVAQAKNVHLYEQTTSQISSFLPANALNNVPLSSTQIQTILTQAIDANTFYSDLGQAAGAYLNYLTGKTTTLNYQLNLKSIKATVTDQATAAVIADYQNLPTCTASQLKTWDAASSFPSCQLPSGNIQTKSVNGLLGNQVTTAVNKLPDNLTAPTANASLKNARSHVMQILQLIEIAWLTTLAVIILYIIVARRKAFLPLALIFLVAGLLEVAFSFVAWDWVKRLIIDLISGHGQSQQVVSVMSTVVSDIVQTLKTIPGNFNVFS